MTTVIDPAGTPVAVFNKSGTAVIDMTISTGDGQPDVAIPYFAGDTIVRVNATFISGNAAVGGVVLPEDAQIGDHVQIASVGSASFNYIAPTGETIDGSSSHFSLGGFIWLRKIDTTDWRRR